MSRLNPELGLLQGIGLLSTSLLGTGIFVIPALAATAAGILFIPTDFLVKGYMGLCALFLVSTSITLSKTLRDEHENQRLINKISEAKTKQLIKEYAE